MVRPVLMSAAMALTLLASAGCGSDSGRISSATPADTADITTSPPAATVAAPRPPDTDHADDGTPLALCDDVPVIATDVMGSDVGGGNLDPTFQGVLQTYIQEHSDTFGGLWIDREAKGTAVLAFTDDPEEHRTELSKRRPSPDDVPAVEPPPPITDDRPIGEWGVAFDVVQVEHTEDEIIQQIGPTIDLLQNAGFAVDGGGGNVMRNRVAVYLSTPITRNDLSAMARVIEAGSVPLDMVCAEAEIVDGIDQTVQPIEPGTALDVIVLPDATGSHPADTPVHCGGISFRFGDLAARTAVDAVDPELKAVLDAWLSTAEGSFWPQDGWTLLFADDDDAQFVNVSNEGTVFVGAERGRNGWIWSGASGGETCVVHRLLPPGMGAVAWEFDPGFPEPGPGATEIHVLATELACTGGSELGQRLLGPQVVETDDAVRIAFAAIPLTGGHTCPGNPSTAVTITLSAPLDGREVLDGLEVGPIDQLAGT
jgi:hypothetical protein